jgi:hypothetical protein
MVWIWVVQGQSGGKFSHRRRLPWVRLAGAWKIWNCQVAGSARARGPVAASSFSQAIRSVAMAWIRYQAVLTVYFFEVDGGRRWCCRV